MLLLIGTNPQSGSPEGRALCVGREGFPKGNPSKGFPFGASLLPFFAQRKEGPPRGLSAKSKRMMALHETHQRKITSYFARLAFRLPSWLRSSSGSLSRAANDRPYNVCTNMMVFRKRWAAFQQKETPEAISALGVL